MLKVGDTLTIRGRHDRTDSVIPAAVWTVTAIAPINDSRMYSAIAQGQTVGGRTVWLSGRLDINGRPGYPPSPMYADDARLWATEQSATVDHEERVVGEAW